MGNRKRRPTTLVHKTFRSLAIVHTLILLGPISYVFISLAEQTITFLDLSLGILSALSLGITWTRLILLSRGRNKFVTEIDKLSEQDLSTLIDALITAIEWEDKEKKRKKKEKKTRKMSD